MKPAPVRRRALLLGVPRQESPAIASLSVVHRDLDIVADALRASRYEVTTIDLGSRYETSANHLRFSIGQFCKDEQSDGATLLLYFSGHGVHWEGLNWLVGCDARTDDLDDFRSGLVAADQTATFNKSKARTIVFMVDACREGVQLPDKAVSLGAWSPEQVQVVGQQRRATVYACGLGQYSRFVVDADGNPVHSVFARALADVMDSGHPARTLRELRDGLRTRVDALCRQHQLAEQEVQVATAQSDLDPVWDELLSDCRLPGAAVDASDAWVHAARQSVLWQRSQGRALEALQAAALRAVAECARQRDIAAASASDDWADAQWPVRVLERIEFLVQQAGSALQLSPAEVWLLVTAPFVAQAVRDAAVAALAAAADQPDGAVARMQQAMPQLARKQQRLAGRGRPGDADTVGAWLLRRAARGSARAWACADAAAQAPDTARADGLLPAALWAVMAPPEALLELAPAQWRERLLALARLVDADPGWREREDLPGFLQHDDTLAPGSAHEQPLRAALLGWTLALSARMALDVMALGEVVVDHVGLADPVSAADAVEHCQQLRWVPHGDGRSAALDCQHPALDLALRDALAQANLLLGSLHLRRTLGLDGLSAVAAWPRNLFDLHLRPARVNGRAAYQTPHVSFQLAHHEVRELLMGQQLYGDPTLAIRELYQNALDACRYLRARLQFLQRTGHGAGAGWQGSIQFRQYQDAEGRAVLECEDNGIGMGRRELEKAFAAVGKRFADMPEFIDEQAAWQRLVPPVRLYPNSRFGIGVLSYFMLADELEILTRRVGLDGSAHGPALRVTVSGSGSLFRIREAAPGSPVDGGGTLLRLYLSRTDWVNQRRGQGQTEQISCVDTLSDLLLRSEFSVRAQHGGRVVDWQPGELRRPTASDDHRLRGSFKHPDDNWVAAPDGLPLWWHGPDAIGSADNGRVLSDGIGTETKLTGCTIDLRDANRPRLTLDRQQVLDLDKTLVGRMATAAVPALLPPPDWLSMQWLWAMRGAWPQASERLLDLLSAGDHHLPLRQHAAMFSSNDPAEAVRVPVRAVGVCRADADIVSGLRSLSDDDRLFAFHADAMRRALPAWLLPWRQAMWRDLGLPLPPGEEPPGLPAGPVPPFVLSDRVVDVLQDRTAYGSWTDRLTQRDQLGAAAKHGITAGALRTELAVLVGMGLQLDELDPGLAELELPTWMGWALDRLLNDTQLAAAGRQLGMMQIIQAAVAAGSVPLAEVHAGLQAVAGPLQLDLPDLPAASADLVVDFDDLRLLSQDLDGRGPWIDLDADVPPRHVMEAARQMALRPRAVLRRLERLQPLGLRLPRLCGPALDMAPSEPLLLHLPPQRDRLGLVDLLQLPMDVQMALGRLAASATRLGWTLDDAARLALLQHAEVVADVRMQALLAVAQAQVPGPSGAPTSVPAIPPAPGLLGLAHSYRGQPGDPVVWRQSAERLAGVLGWQLPALPWTALPQLDAVDEELLGWLVTPIIGGPPTALTVPVWRVLIVAAIQASSMAQAWAGIDAAVGPLGACVEPVPQELTDQVPVEAHGQLFFTGGEGEEPLRYDPRPDWSRMQAFATEVGLDLAQALQAARPWQALGLVLPDGDPPAAEPPPADPV